MWGFVSQVFEQICQTISSCAHTQKKDSSNIQIWYQLLSVQVLFLIQRNFFGKVMPNSAQQLVKFDSLLTLMEKKLSEETNSPNFRNHCMFKFFMTKKRILLFSLDKICPEIIWVYGLIGKGIGFFLQYLISILQDKSLTFIVVNLFVFFPKLSDNICK